MRIVPPPAPERIDDAIQEVFEAFHEDNPQVLARLEEMAGAWLATHRRCSTKMLFEALRYEKGLHTEGDPYKLNNNFTSRYVRLMLQRHPAWRGRFELRKAGA